MIPNAAPPPIRSDIEESELQDMLQTVIDARCGLSAIHQLLDGAQTMSEIRARFSQIQPVAGQSARRQIAADGDTPNKSINGTQEPTRHHD